MTSPLVTVYLPTRDRVGLLQRAVNSVREQTFPDFELIIVDDGSVDRTQEYLAELVRTEPRARSVRNEHSEGACRARNKAISAAQGEFVTGLDDDDYFLPQRLEEFFSLWKHRRPGTIALASGRIKRMPGGKILTENCPPLIVLEQLYLRNLVGSQVFVETEVARELAGFDASLEAWQDLEFLLRLLRLGNVEGTRTNSYVVDLSHHHERISTRSFTAVRDSCEHIIRKLHLEDRDALRLRSQKLVYKYDWKAALGFACSFVRHRDIAGLKAVVMRGYRALQART